eukprot:CAMPEP_0116096150 /NCGR_PEP_ID=MMETSP0327-20121206/10035_1 /TAXON_ID=44447 /ORGANISM="Pseudo-nitzschia delicatissima, Strain B596" /LENGTH=492 /DNA_ID=CAMNT_0003587849 /DNA_START=93 /DNA_END=1571 /DNA_ORIENTATION=+
MISMNYFEVLKSGSFDIDASIQTNPTQRSSYWGTFDHEEWLNSNNNETTPDKQTKKHKHDFTYDQQKWGQSPRIAVLAGPHKTASTTLQSFFSKIVGSAVRLTNETSNSSDTNYQPHPALSDWAWPIGVVEEYESESSLGGGFMKLKPYKFYAILASLISGRRRGLFFKFKTQQQIEKATQYHRALFRSPWEEGKNLVIAAEAFDTLVEDLVDGSGSKDGKGEETHVAPASEEMIDALLGLFPWDNSESSSETSGDSRITPLKREEIEVHINYRTPKISHVRSIWHQLGKKNSLRTFLLKDNRRHNLYQSNSLGLALQFVRRGIKTSLLDMTGVAEHEITSEKTKSETIVGGLRGIVACDILQMGKNNNLCDDQSRLHLPEYNELVRDKNKKKDKNPIDLTPQQMDEINAVMEEYDCAVWQHLKKYQEQGTLRILYPGENLFGNCDPMGNRDISFESTMDKVVEIASQENGIQFTAEEEQKIQKRIGKKARV